MPVTITITFSERVENHTGMEIIGEEVKEGFNIRDLVDIKNKLTNYETEIYYLNKPVINLDKEFNDDINNRAYILVVKDFVNKTLQNKDKSDKELYEEQTSFEWDSKMFSRKHKSGVVNKNARHNVCYANFSQEADFINKKGTVIDFEKLPLLNYIKEFLSKLNKKCENLFAEGNKYYDITKCGIGFHGDTERKKVIGLRIGSNMDLHYQWYLRFKPVGKRMKIPLKGGDLYIMSNKAVGNDWKKSSILTLRHATGSYKYTNPKKEILEYLEPEKLKMNNISFVKLFCSFPSKSNLIFLNSEIFIYLKKLLKFCIKHKKGNLKKVEDMATFIL
jgi:hypothetical protein